MSGLPREELIGRLQRARDRRELRRLVGDGRGVDADMVNRLCAEADSAVLSDPRLALRGAEAALVISGMLDYRAGLASSSWAKASALRALGKYREAIALYEEARRSFRELDMVVEAASTQIGKVDALMYQSRYAEALATATEARSELLSCGANALAAKVDTNIGNVYHRMDRYEEALRHYDHARDAFVALHLDVLAAHQDVNRANVFTLLNDFRRAQEAYLGARATCEAAGQWVVVAMIDANLGFLYFLQGHYNRALERLTLARTVFEQLNVTKNAIVVDLDLADVYLTLSLPEEAKALSERSYATCSRSGMRLEGARATAIGAFAHIQLGEHDRAVDLLAKARQSFDLEGNKVWVATLDLHSAALLSQDTCSEAGKRQALELCVSARVVFQRRGLAAKSAYAQIVEGRLRESLGMIREAARLYRNALRSASRLRLPWLLYQVHHALGRMEEAAAPESARRRYVRAIQAIESMWQDLQPEDLRTAFLTRHLQVYEDLVLLSLKGGPVDARRAFQYVEQAKSRALVDLLAGRLEVRIRDRGNGDLVARLSTLREELNWLYNKLNEGEAPAGQRSQDWSAQIADQIHDRELQISQVLRQLQMRGGETMAFQQETACSVEGIQGLLSLDATLVEYYQAGGRLFAFVINRDHVWVEMNLCSYREASERVERLRFQLDKFSFAPAYAEAHTAQLCAATNEHLRRLYDGLIRPLRSLLKGQKIIVVPHGVLHYVPFHALFDGQHHLVEDFEVSYTPSSRVLELCHWRPSGDPGRALIVGVADDRAPLVADEVASLGELFPEAKTLVGEEATVAAFHKHASGCDIVHIASHGVFAPANPMFSRVRLADGWITVHDVYDLELEASLVTLSACETGLSRVAGGDELIGLARGFFYAGARSLLLSLWAVNDASTVRLMQSFYRRLLSGESKAAALRGAQLEIKEQYAHPYHWAAFMLLGRNA